MSFVTFLTTIWGEGVVFGWLVDLTGISSLLVWGTVGVISLRFRAAWKAQGRSTKDLPYTQPLFPVLPWLTIILAIAMLVAQGYASVVETPFDVKVRARSACLFLFPLIKSNAPFHSIFPPISFNLTFAFMGPG